MKIGVFGSGGVGGYFGARLAAAGGEVHFLSRGAHLEAMRRDGLRLQSPKGDLHLPSVRATDDPAAIGPCDVVLFTVKMYDVDAAAAQLAPMIGPGTAVITLQNGIDAVEMVARHVGRPHVVGGVAYVAAVIDVPGVIRHTALDTLIFGELDGRRTPRLEALAALGQQAGFGTQVTDRVQVALWSKFARLSVFSGMTAVTRSPIGVLRDDPVLYEMLLAACHETIAVGRAHGIAFPDDILDDVLRMLNGLPPGAKASMLEDLERGRRLELPWLSGAVARLGREVGVPTPIHQFIAAVLAPMVAGRPAPAR